MKIIYLIIFLGLFVPVVSHAQVENDFAWRELGLEKGFGNYLVKNTGEKGKYPISNRAWDLVYCFDNSYYFITNFNYIINGNDAYKAGKDGSKGADLSFFQAQCGKIGNLDENSSFGGAFYFNWGYYGPWLKHDNGSYYQDRGEALAIGGSLSHHLVAFKYFRLLTFVTPSLLFTNNQEKAIDGYALRIETRLQFVPTRYVGIGIKPSLEYRSYKLGGIENTSVSTFVPSIQFTVGLNLWGNARRFYTYEENYN